MKQFCLEYCLQYNRKVWKTGNENWKLYINSIPNIFETHKPTHKLGSPNSPDLLQNISIIRMRNFVMIPLTVQKLHNFLRRWRLRLIGNFSKYTVSTINRISKRFLQIYVILNFVGPLTSPTNKLGSQNCTNIIVIYKIIVLEPLWSEGCDW